MFRDSRVDIIKNYISIDKPIRTCAGMSDSETSDIVSILCLTYRGIRATSSQGRP